MAKQIIKLLKKEHPDYHYTKKVFEYIRKDLGLSGKTAPSAKPPEVLSDQELAKFWQAVSKADKRTHIVMIKLLLYTGVRNSELVGITLEDIDIEAHMIKIIQQEREGNRFVPFPEFFRDELGQYMDSQKARRATYLFETNRQNKFTTRWVRQIIKNYALEAGISKRISPHLFRHQLLAYLASTGIIDDKLQSISGHKDKKAWNPTSNSALPTLKRSIRNR